jgi:flagellar hook capping protein FlgD
MKKTIKLLLVTAFLLPVVLFTTQAQEAKLLKSVIGAGGTVGSTVVTDNGPITLNGTVAQTAVETKQISGTSGPGVKIYEGFWTPGVEVISGVEDEGTSANTLSNYPNPFSTSTNIQFTLEKPSNVTIRVYDINGALVSTVVSNQLFSAVTPQNVSWDAKDQYGTQLSSGSYLYELSIEPTTGGRSFSLRNVMVIVK